MSGGWRGVLWRCAHSGLPCLIGVPVIAALLASLADLVQVQHPDLGWAQAIGSDAKALAVGEGLYGDPSEGYAGMLYTPLFPAILAPLYRLSWWEGWPALVATLASMALGGLVGAVAASGPGVRGLAERVLAGVGLGGTGWWLVSGSPGSMLFEGRADHLAWLLALSGLAVLAADVERGRRRTWPAVVLLSAAIWTKQTTAGAAVAAVIVVAWWVRTGLLPVRLWWRFAGALAGVNAASGVVVLVVTHGWAWRLMVELPGRHAVQYGASEVAAELVRHLALPGVLLLIALVGVTRGDRVDGRSFSVLLATLLGAFVVASIAPTWLARQKQGGDANQWIGMVWASALLLAILHREGSRSIRGMAAGAAAYGVLLLAAFVPAGHDVVGELALAPAEVGSVARWDEMPAGVVEYAEEHAVYLPRHGVLGPASKRWATQTHVIDLLAAGIEPRHLVEALRERHFDAVMPFDEDDWYLDYVSRSGLSSPTDLQQLNAVIAAGYSEGVGGAPAPLWGRRSREQQHSEP